MTNSYTVPDPRDWADIILDDAPPCPPQYKQQTVAAEPVPAPYQRIHDDNLLAQLLALQGPFTADAAAEKFKCYASSVRLVMRNYPQMFRRTNPVGSAPAIWQVVEQP